MKHLKTYENWFTNLFKDSEYDMWDDYLNYNLETTHKYNVLMRTAEEGDLKKFMNYLPEYVNNNKLHNISKEGKNVLHYVVTGDGDLYNKKEMIKLLINSDIDYTIKFENKTFYDLIEEPKLKLWFDKTYPEISEKINMIKNSEKYNL